MSLVLSAIGTILFSAEEEIAICLKICNGWSVIVHMLVHSTWWVHSLISTIKKSCSIREPCGTDRGVVSSYFVGWTKVSTL